MRKLDLSLMLLACLLVPPSSADGVAPTVVGRGAYPDLAVDSAGDVHLVYVRSGDLHYRKWDSASRAWGPETDTGLSATQPNRSDPEVALDSAERPHVLVGSSYAYWNGGDWISIAPGITRDTAMAIDSQDNVYVCKRGGANGGYLGLRLRRAGTDSFVSLPDPDTADGLPLGRNDHVYGHVFVNPVDDSVHLVYRHGNPTDLAYRASTNGGENWFGGGVSGDDAEGPSGHAASDGTIYVAGGHANIYRRTGTPSSWTPLGRAINAAGRDNPALATDTAGNLYVTTFGGKYNVRSGGEWVGERILPRLSDKPLGYAEVQGGPGSFVYVVWEEGDEVIRDVLAGTSDILFATIDSAGHVGQGGQPADPPEAPQNLTVN
jgi:hypothetical protein